MLRALAHLDAVSIRLLLAAGANYLRRYYAVAWCLFLCVLCVWTIVFRIATHLYPWEVELLASGLALQESEMINSLLRLLR
jgi:hypothetical protein